MNIPANKLRIGEVLRLRASVRISCVVTTPLKMDTYADLRRQLQGNDATFLLDVTSQMSPDEPLGVKKYINNEGEV